MTDDFERLCRAAWQGSCASVARFGGNAISDEHGRAIVLAVLREQKALLDGPHPYDSGNDAHPWRYPESFIADLIAQAEGGQKQ